MRHTIVYARAGTFAGWPANNGVWSWDGRELLVGFTLGAFEEQPGHNIREPYRSVLARSLDQGESWMLVEPEGFVGSGVEVRPLPETLDFTAPGFALRVEGTGYHGSDRPEGAFYITRDRGSHWEGPFSFGIGGLWPQMRGWEITSRTDYIVEGSRACLVMMSARTGPFLTDRVFCVRTTDGGRSFTFVAWVVPPADPYRAVMPATARCASGELVTAVRRREPGTQHCWIDAYTSADQAQSWRFAAKIADTGAWNGNPPALARLADGRLCCVYGERDACRMLARYSRDQGKTWGEERVLRDDYQRDAHGDADMGYPRLIQRADGQLIAMYYWATRELPHQHIAATIWEPE